MAKSLRQSSYRFGTHLVFLLLFLAIFQCSLDFVHCIFISLYIVHYYRVGSAFMACSMGGMGMGSSGHCATVVAFMEVVVIFVFIHSTTICSLFLAVHIYMYRLNVCMYGNGIWMLNVKEKNDNFRCEHIEYNRNELYRICSRQNLDFKRFSLLFSVFL